MAGRIKWLGLTKRQQSKARKAYAEFRESGKSEAYSKRLARGVAKGKSRQAARGHKVHEHVERREREREEGGGVSSQDLKSIRSFLSRFNPREYKDVPTEEDIVEFIVEHGYAQFQEYRKVWDAARRQYLKEYGEGSYESRGMGYLFQLQAMAGAPDERWLYYH